MTDISRRALLTRLGLAAGAAYVAPGLIGFDAAHADDISKPSGRDKKKPSRPSKPSRPKRGKHSRPSKLTRPTRPTRPSKPTRPTRPTRPSRPGRNRED